MKKDFVSAPHWSIDKWVSVLTKAEDKRKGFNIT